MWNFDLANVGLLRTQNQVYLGSLGVLLILLVAGVLSALCEPEDPHLKNSWSLQKDLH